MHMTFETIQPDMRHPALKAAEIIKQMHVETIALIDGGQVFMKDGVDVSEEMRRQCAWQIEKCDELIEYARVADPAAWKPEGFLLEQAEEVTLKKRAERDAALEEPLPEIGNYGHETE